MPPLILKIDKPHYQTGDLWDYHRLGYWVVVTTNIGWKKNGENVMGAGIAKQAATRFPELPAWYGELCMSYKDAIGICLYNEAKLIMLPVKRLNRANPALSWQAAAQLPLVDAMIAELAAVVHGEHLKQVALSYPGCGNGGLEIKQVRPLLNKYLNSKFTVVTYAKADKV